MSDLTPRSPKRPLIWSNPILDLQEKLPGIDDEVYIVGGAVRDAYLHRPVKDLDLATSGSAIMLARLIANSLEGDVFVLDAERDVARVLLEGKLVIDIAGFRGEGLLADLQDRDFTINAMAVDLNGDLNLLIDPLRGEDDIITRQLRRCSPASVASDVIRSLRAVRQSAQLGFRIEPETLQDVRANAPRLKETSGERIRDELMKLLALPKPVGALRIADQVGLLAVIVPELAALHTLLMADSPTGNVWEHTLLVIEKLNILLSTISFMRTDNTAATFEMGMIVMEFDRYRAQLNQHINTVWADDRPHRALLMLAALLHETGAARSPDASAQVVEAQAAELRLSNAEKHRLTLTVKHHQHPAFIDTVTPLIAHRFWYTLGEAGVDVILLALANYLGTHGHMLEQDVWLEVVHSAGALLEAYYERYDDIVSPAPLLDGNQLKELLHLKPGPIVGELLTLLREGQVEGRILSVADALREAQMYLDQMR